MAICRAKQSISLERLKEIGKATLKEPSSKWYLNEDVATVVDGHSQFFVACAPHTKRLNPASLALMGKEHWQMTNREANLFGQSLSSAFSHCMSAGSRATSGAKLPKAVWMVYHASLSAEEAHKHAKAEPCVATMCKAEPEIKTEPCTGSPPRKKVRMCLSSPSQIAAMYSGSGSACSSSGNAAGKVICFFSILYVHMYF